MKKKSSSAQSRKKSGEPTPSISEASIQRKTDVKVFGRGEDYFESGMIIKPVRVENILFAHCQGSGYEPYRVKVTFNKRAIGDAACDCPYDWGGYCKHLVALLLIHIRAPEKIEARESVATVLVDWKQDELTAVIAQMVEHYPELYGLLDGSGIVDEGPDFYDDRW